jgi:hypothetical protein
MLPDHLVGLGVDHDTAERAAQTCVHGTGVEVVRDLLLGGVEFGRGRPGHGLVGGEGGRTARIDPAMGAVAAARSARRTDGLMAPGLR